MFLDIRWGISPPAPQTRLTDWLTDTGSLTERLAATGHAFSVSVLQQGPDLVSNDEMALIGVSAEAAIYARHVALMLDQTPVVVARSITRADSTHWLPILQRGKRSLGLTLFGPDSKINREALFYARVTSGHPLYPLAQQSDPSLSGDYAARRSNFVLDGQVMNVCEIFLPALEDFL